MSNHLDQLARLAKEFPTEDARKKYLKEHPDADPKNHSVKEKGSEGEEGKGADPLKKIPEKAEPSDLPPAIREEIADYKISIVGQDAKKAVEIARKLKRGIDRAADICKMSPSVCKSNKGLTRDKMPQIEGEKSVKQMLASDKPEEKAKGEAMVQAGADPKSDKTVLQSMIEHLTKNGVETEEVEMPVGHMKATQSEIKADKVFGMADAHLKGKFDKIDASVVVSKDGHILDGHHRWAALLTIDPSRKMKVKQIDMTMDELLKEAASYPGVYKADFSGKPLAKADQEKYKADNKSKYSKAEKKAGRGIMLKFSSPKVEFDGSVTFEKGEPPSGLVEVLNLVLTNGVTSVEVDIAGTIEVEVAHGGNLWECTIKSVNDLALPSTITTRKIEVEGSMLSAGGRKFPFRGFFHPTGYFQEAWDTMKNDNLSKLAALAGPTQASDKAGALDELSKLAAAPPVSPVELTSAANDALMKIAKLFPGGSAAHGRVFKPGAGQVLEWDGAVKFGSGNELLMIVSWSPTRNTCVYDFQMTHRESAYEDLFPRELEEFLPTAGHTMAAYDMLRMLTQGSILKGLAAAVKRVEKAVREIADAEGRKLAKFEEGTPADPTENMSPEDAAEWHRMNDEHKDNFKAAAGSYTIVKDPNQARLATAATAALKEIAKILGGQITENVWGEGITTHTIEGENLLADREHVQFLDWSGTVKAEHLTLDLRFYADPKDKDDLLNGGVLYTFSAREHSDVPEIRKMLSNIHMLRALNTDASAMLKALAKTVDMVGEVADRVALFGNARKKHVSEMKFAEALLSKMWQEQVEKTFPGAEFVSGTVYSDWSREGPQKGELRATLPEEAPSNASAIMKKLVNLTLATVQREFGVSFEVGRARKDRSAYWLPFVLVPSLGKAASSKSAKLMARQESILKKYLDEGGDARLVDDLPGDVLAALRRVKDQETLESDVDRWFSDNSKKARSAASALPGDEKLSRYEEGVPADPTENMSPEDKAEWEKNTDEHKDKFKAASTKEAAQGLYGFTKGVQSDCEACVRKVSRTADSIARRIWAKDENVAPFLVAHSKRASSLPAKILVGAIKKLGPQIEDEVETAEEQEPEETAKQEKTAAKGLKYGLYGYSAKTSSLGLSAATELREVAGHIAGDLHSRRADKAEHITGFLNSHGKTAKCLYSKLLAASYPEGVTKKAASMGVSDWLAWTPVEGE